jgi:hypothetical protein
MTISMLLLAARIVGVSIGVFVCMLLFPPTEP